MPMDPLNEVSTDRGDYMRETCARVLAAALMTGAIAAVVAMSALYEAPQEAGRALTAPPSSLQRSVRLIALPAPHSAPAPRPQPIRAQPRIAVVRRVVVRRVTVVRRAAPPRHLAATKPQPTPPPAPVLAPAP